MNNCATPFGFCTTPFSWQGPINNQFGTFPQQTWCSPFDCQFGSYNGYGFNSIPSFSNFPSYSPWMTPSFFNSGFNSGFGCSPFGYNTGNWQGFSQPFSGYTPFYNQGFGGINFGFNNIPSFGQFVPSWGQYNNGFNTPSFGNIPMNGNFSNWSQFCQIPQWNSWCPPVNGMVNQPVVPGTPVGVNGFTGQREAA